MRLPVANISIVTLGVEDLVVSTAFYENLGWTNTAASQDSVTFFQGHSVVLGLFGRAALAEDVGVDNTHTAYLQPWAEQGVLLLNAVLTVEAGNANAHQGKGWEGFTDAIIAAINEQAESVVFILWGAYAQKKAKAIDNERHLVIKSVHPSPLSAYRGFYGSKPFSKTNDYLMSHGKAVINWQL